MRLTLEMCFFFFTMTILLLLHTSSALPTSERRGGDLSELRDAYTTLQVLEELTDLIRSDIDDYDDKSKRSDGRYGRFGSHGVGSKLMALKQAPDWNGPGRKKRSTQ